MLLLSLEQCVCNASYASAVEMGEICSVYNDTHLQNHTHAIGIITCTATLSSEDARLIISTDG